MTPLAIDLFCGLGGWTEGLLAEGWDVIGFDIERHDYGTGGYPAQLVLQDVTTLHGRQFKDVALIVASPPCQAYSYRAMPWKRAKALPPPDNSLFDACFRIQRETCEAAGRHVPLIVENVRGAQKWVGRAKWNYGSYYLWGDVPALMPMTLRAQKVNPDGTAHPPGNWFAIADSKERGAKQPGRNFHFPEKYGIPSPSFHGHDAEPSVVAAKAIKNNGGSWFNVANNTTSGKGQNPVTGIKQPGISGPRNNGRGDKWFQDGAAQHGSKSTKRKAASAMIAKIPLPLSRHIARCYRDQHGV